MKVQVVRDLRVLADSSGKADSLTAVLVSVAPGRRTDPCPKSIQYKMSQTLCQLTTAEWVKFHISVQVSHMYTVFFICKIQHFLKEY